ncbi:acyltransferase [Piscinibacter sp. HJYY11]|uniref:acyltransferase family protein n=1 Tax=Piscinibacter sp. HJYY11 TaxID=2801333 RepID=UPI00191D54BA|nr:acyltransferase [Piscinibacter sp. HJYY11]MBL0730696.1 acyltransferase [Piscinibacter sp. HJYY11]
MTTPNNTHPPSQQILSLNAIRGLAALLVVVSHLPEQAGLHFGPIHEGSLGVMVFFTLSGFLMGYLYLGKPADWHEVSRYAIARFSRIAPPYLMVVLASFFIYTLIDPKFPYAIGTHNFLRHLLFSGNVSVFWSIPPEVQFYALFIGFWWALKRAQSGRTLALVVVMVLAVAAICVRDKVPGTFAISKLHYFLLGSMMGGLHPWVRTLPISTRALTVLQVLLLGALGLFMLEIIHLPEKYWHDLAPALIAGLVVFAFSHDRTPIDMAFMAKPFQWFGDWSFSIYLIHVPLIYLFVKAGWMKEAGPLAVLCVVAAVAGCALFSIFIERPSCAATKRGLTAWLKRIEASAKPRLVPHITPDRTRP